MPASGCTCGHPGDFHEHYHAGVYCGTCGAAGCPRFRPVRVRWWQFWRPLPVLGELTDYDLRLLAARPEEIT